MRKLFISAALFNWSVALLFLLLATPTLTLLGITVPHNPVWMHFFAVLVAGFGLGYYRIARHPPAAIDMILTGATAKTALVIAGIVEVALGNIAVSILLPLSVDLLYAVLFFRAARLLRAA